jgi:putative ABC transport system permease protein
MRLPMKEDEVAMTETALRKLGAEIGDRVKIDADGGIGSSDAERELIITGTFSSFMNGGYAARLCESTPITHDRLSNFLGIQFEFDEQLDAAGLRRNADKVKEIFDIEKVLTNAELVDFFTSMSGTMNGIKKVMMVMTVIVASLIVILMERSFISKEKTEKALMKAVGLRSRSIVGQHVMRFGIAALIAASVASATVLPISKWLINFIFAQVGSVKGIGVAFDAFEIFFTCPAILISVTIVGSFLTALYMKTITATDAASIE